MSERQGDLLRALEDLYGETCDELHRRIGRAEARKAICNPGSRAYRQWAGRCEELTALDAQIREYLRPAEER